MQPSGGTNKKAARQTMTPKTPATATSRAGAKPVSEPLKGVALVVEDNAEDRCGDLLEREGLEVLTATTREQGLQVAQEQHPELVVVDLSPESGGKELAMELKLLPALARVPVIGIRSTPGQDADVKVFDACLSRPIDREELRKVVRQLLGRRVKREVAARRDRPLKIKS